VAISGRLSRKLLLAFLFVALVPLGLLAAFGPRIVRRHFQDLSRERIASVLSQVGRDLDLKRATLKLQVEILAGDPVLVRELALVGPEGVPNLALIDYMVERREALGLDWLEVTDSAGTVLARGHSRGDFGVALADEPLVAAARRGTSLAAISNLVPPDSLGAMADSGLAILAATPVVFEGNVLGVVRGGTRLDRSFANRLGILSGADIAVIDSSGQVRASTFIPDPTQPFAVVRALDGPTAPLDSGIVLRDSTREIRLESVPFRVGALNLMGPAGHPVGRLAVGVSEADLEKTLTSLLRLLGAAALIALFVAIGVALVFAINVARPVRALALAAQRVAHGDLTVRLPAGPNDEVGDLMSSFNAMAVDLTGSRERLVRGERQAAWAQVARRLAHDIRNPLTPIQLAIEEIERARAENDPHLGEVIARCGKTIKAEVRALRELVREFGDFARSPAPRPEAIDLHELLDHAADLYVPSSIAVERDYAYQGPAIHADPDLLTRAFGNLVKNACEAMAGQGRLTLATRAVEGGVEVSIADTGPGVPAEDREKIFTPYYTTKEDGTGLGLAIVRRVLEDHGGSLALAPGAAGARFVAELPLRPPGVGAQE
jgi:nitrogen fixation/metabolism regulation signal transduction histidine kinase